MTSSFWRKSAYWWMLMISMLLAGTVLTLSSSRPDSWFAQLLKVLFAIGAYGLALIAVVMVIRVWIEHRRSARAQ